MRLFAELAFAVVGGASGYFALRAVRARQAIPTPWMSRCGALAVVLASALACLGAILLHGAGDVAGMSVVAFPPLLVLSASDWLTHRLPKAVVWPGAIASLTVGIVTTLLGRSGWHLLVGVVAGTCLFAFLYCLNRIDPSWIGYGDVRLALFVGFVLGWRGAVALSLALIVANLAAIAFVLGRALFTASSLHEPVAYGSFLAVSAVAALLVVSSSGAF